MLRHGRVAVLTGSRVVLLQTILLRTTPCSRLTGQTLGFASVGTIRTWMGAAGQAYEPRVDLLQGSVDVGAIALNNIRDNPGAKKQKRRKGRGIGCSKGKTCGRGHKGHKSRSGGGVAPWFEGGQNPLSKRVRKMGFTNMRFKREFLPVNLSKLQYWIDTGRINPDEKITMKVMRQANLIPKLTKRHEHGIKLLGTGADWFGSKVEVEVSRVSQRAKDCIEALGGTVTEVYYHRHAIQRGLKAKSEWPEPQEYRDKSHIKT